MCCENPTSEPNLLVNKMWIPTSFITPILLVILICLSLFYIYHEVEGLETKLNFPWYSISKLFFKRQNRPTTQIYLSRHTLCNSFELFPILLLKKSIVGAYWHSQSETSHSFNATSNNKYRKPLTTIPVIRPLSKGDKLRKTGPLPPVPISYSPYTTFKPKWVKGLPSACLTTCPFCQKPNCYNCHSP